MFRFTKVMAIALTALLTALPVAANHNYASNVSINGYRLSVQELVGLQRQLGTVIPAGAYVVDQNGCWANLTTGQNGCPGTVNAYSRYGSGERTSDGSWNHYSNSAGMGVGGTSDGCIYTTTGWSNC